MKYLLKLSSLPFRHLLSFGLLAACLLFAAPVNALTGTDNVTPKISTNADNLLQLAAVDLSKILPFLMGAGDVFQGYENVVYRGRQALKLRIFNQQSGRVRYIFIDAQSGQILKG